MKNKYNFFDILLFFLSILVCSLLRPHYLVCIVWLYFSTMIIRKYYNYKNFVLISIVFWIIFDLFFVIYDDTILFRALSSIEYYPELQDLLITIFYNLSMLLNLELKKKL